MARIFKNLNRRRTTGLALAILLVIASAALWSTNRHESTKAAGTANRAGVHSALQPSDTEPYDWTANPFNGPSIQVASAAAASNYVPFKVVLPTKVAPTAIWVADPAVAKPEERGLAANFNDSAIGLFQIFEKRSAMSEADLEHWAVTCTSCSVQQVITVAGHAVLLMATPDRGLGVSWLRGGSIGILTTIQGPYDSFTEQAATTLASDMITQGG